MSILLRKNKNLNKKILNVTCGVKNECIMYLLLCSVLLIVTGSWWAQQELNWGGWWV
jgi:cytochrome c biogenesis factor